MSDQNGHGGKRDGSGRKTKYRSQDAKQSIAVPKEYADAVYEFLAWLDKTTYPSSTDRLIRQYLESRDNQD